jgi:hypothetical protein
MSWSAKAPTTGEPSSMTAINLKLMRSDSDSLLNLIKILKQQGYYN